MGTKARRRDSGLVGGVKIDIRRLHGAWMELVFRRQRGKGHSVLGRWKPETLPQKVAYYSWYLIGALGLVLLYPLTIVGFATRYYARRIDSTAARLGLVGVIGVSIVVWGLLIGLARIQLEFEGFIAVVAASVVATVAASFAVITKRLGGRLVTVVLSYPLAMTGIFLPPVVAAFYYDPLQQLVFSGSYDLAYYILEEVLYIGGLNDLIRDQFDLEGSAYILMWLVLSFPVGWFLGLVVELANLARPSA